MASRALKHVDNSSKLDEKRLLDQIVNIWREEWAYVAYQHRISSVASLRPYGRNARTHSGKQIRQIANSIERFGFINPVLIGDDDRIIAGHGRVQAARLLNLDQVPTLRLSHLSGEERRAYILADNKLAQNAGWDREILALEMQALCDLDFDVDLTGFGVAEIDLILDEAKEGSPEASSRPEDELPELGDPTNSVARAGDIWLVGRHRLICGDSRSADTFEKLLSGEKVDLIFTDPPYNVPVDGHVCGLGRIRHREFAMGVGEMSPDAFTGFLQQTLGHAAAQSRDGAIAFVCMDWRHLGELLAAGQVIFSELKNICVWNKSNAGMGTFYRSKHELVLVFKVGTAPTPIPSGAATPDAIAPTSGITLGSIPFARDASRSLKCARLQSQSPWSRTRSEIAPGAARSCSIRLADPPRRLSRRRRRAGSPGSSSLIPPTAIAPCAGSKS